MSSFLFYTTVLFLIIDPFGKINQLQALMQNIPAKKRKTVLLREMIFALILMVVVNFLGEFIFNVLELSRTTLSLAAGVILFLVAIKILFPALGGKSAPIGDEEPYVVPIAIPLIAGPSLLATIVLFANLEPVFILTLASIFLAWGLALLVFFAGPYIQRILGNNGLVAIERLMGMILMLLAIQRLAEGIQLFYMAHVVQ